MATFTSVNRTKLQQAFALAHHAGEDPNSTVEARRKFRKVALLIWEAHGESGLPPAGAGSAMLNEMSTSADPEAKRFPKA